MRLRGCTKGNLTIAAQRLFRAGLALSVTFGDTSPSGRAGERSETERASPGQKSFCAAISRFFVRAILSLCFYISVSILALSVCFAATSPKGRGFHAVERAQKAPRISAGGLKSLMLFYQTG